MSRCPYCGRKQEDYATGALLRVGFWVTAILMVWMVGRMVVQ
jgi:hypothetical protein